MAVSKRLRFEIFKRDNHQCRYCGATPPDVKLTIDHVVPEALGGTNDPANLCTACDQCNGGKSSTSPDAAVVADVAQAAVRWSAAMRQAAEENKLNDNTAVYEGVVKAWTSFRRNQIPADYRETIDQFLNAGLPAEDIIQMAHVADAKPSLYNRWSYFCGCCWTRIRQLQERATEILSGEGADTEPPIVVRTRWTQDDLEYHLTVGSPTDLECEYHSDERCLEDTLCQIVVAARILEREFQRGYRSTSIAFAAGEAEDYIYG